ncbi:MAG: M3 family oligoendopeptidase [Bacteroidota bacterium]|nr:M3 family oligoendopeptidase [Bacteroidota bacterium]
MEVKFKDFEYKRPDIKFYQQKFDELLHEFENAGSAAEQFAVWKKIDNIRNDYYTMSKIANIRYTINTEDKFYREERKYFDNAGPVYAGFRDKIYAALRKSGFRKELERFTGKTLFDIADLYNKTFIPEIIDDLKTENKLVTDYVQLIASAKIFFEGKTRNLSGMEIFMQSENRQLRKNAYETKWKFFENNEEKFDEIYDDLVKIRTKIATKLGYKNYVELGYDRLGRIDYTNKEVADFRDHIKKYIVPVAQNIYQNKKQRLGLEQLYYYDSSFNFKSGNPTPKGSPEWIVEKAKKMYEELSSETGKFINLMVDRDLMDLYNREGKSAGGYCSYIANYKSPFIFANMNGTSDDVRVLTHEAGHAFQAYESRNFDIMEYINPTLEACEIHSMSMEFITIPWMQLFFEEDTEKFLFSHLCGRMTFIPYGVSVDEFQHYVYENPEASPEDRKEMWREIERKYLPHINYADNNFLNRGGFWFHQAHIFKRPFYYIDYCLAEICALQFWRKCNHDRDVAWDDYLRLCKAGGSESFLELLKIGKIDSPFDEKVVASIVSYTDEWLVSVNKGFEYDQLT